MWMQTMHHVSTEQPKTVFSISQSHHFWKAEGCKVETLPATLKQALAAQKGMFRKKELSYQQP